MTLFNFTAALKDLVVPVAAKDQAAVAVLVEEALADLLAALAVADQVEAAGIVPNGLDDQTDRS